MNKRIVLTIIAICSSLCITGCGEALYTMTPEEETIVSLYAAKMVSKFNKNQLTGIANARVRQGELDEVRGISSEEEVAEVEAPDYTADELEAMYQEGISENNEENESIPSGFDLNQAMGIEGIDFSITSLDVTNEFAANSSFVLTEVTGKVYVVLKITGTNVSSGEVNFADYSAADYALSINGSSKFKTQYSFLDNDLSVFSGSIAEGESEDFVLVFQTDTATASDIKSINLEVTRDGENRGTTISI